MMYRIGICDDEEACRIEISESIRNIALKNDIEVKIIQYESGIQVMDCEKPDILILDIEMVWKSVICWNRRTMRY